MYSVFSRLTANFNFLWLHLLLTPLLCCSSLNAQNLQFEQIPSELGLSQGLISCLFQDSHGFLWVGTKDGLNRFDGYNFKVYRTNSFDSTSISDNYIKSIFEDREGRLWVGTINGLNLFDREKERFTRILPRADDPNSLSHPEINDIIQASDGTLWISTNGGGLNKLLITPQGFKFSHIRKENGLGKDIVGFVVEDGSGDLWVKMEKLIQKIIFTKNTDQYRLASFDFSNFSEEWQQKASINQYLQQGKRHERDERIYTFFKAQDGGIWFATAPGFVKWNPGNKAFKYFPGLHSKNNGILVIEGTDYGRGLEDSKGRLWVNGLRSMVVFDPQSLKFEGAYHTRMTNLPGNFYPSVPSLIEGQSDVFWIGTNGYGLFKCTPDKTQFPHIDFKGLPSDKNSVRAIFPYGDQELLISLSSFELLHFDRKTQKITPIYGDEKYGDRKLMVYTIFKDNTDTIWIGGRDGLFQLQEKKGQLFYTEIASLKKVSDTDSLKSAYVFGIREDVKGKLWLLTSTRFGYFDRKSRKFIAKPYLDPKFGNTNLSNFPSFLAAEDGTFWLGTVDGLKHYDPVSQTFTTFRNNPSIPTSLSHNVIRSIVPDPTEAGILWIGTAGGGLNRFDIGKSQFQHFKIENGLPDDVVYGILSDDAGQLWLSTNQGLCKFDPQTKIPRNYNISDGLQDNEFNSLAFAKSANGELFFGGINGLNVFYPDQVKDQTFVPPVVFTDFQLFNKSIDFKIPDGPLQKSITETDEIVLNYEDKVFSFQFAALDFTSPEKIQYAYRLKNFDKDWQYIGKQRTATFTNLDPGTYTFQVKSTNSDGIWNEIYTSMKIIIRPPWYLTFWAITIFVLFVLGALLLFYRFNLSRHLVKEEARRLKELDVLKTRLYTNITHEIRTPLTVISGIIESFRDSPLPKHQKAVELIERNSQNLIRLVNQMLDLSKLEAGKLELRQVTGDIISYLQYLTESFHSSAESKEINLTFYSEVHELIMEFDEEKIQHIINNLLSNALKFTPKRGEVVLHLRTTQWHGKSYLNILVKDTGIGIAKADINHIFDRFYQADYPSPHSGEGTGIGLALTRELILLMEGFIEVKSKENQGSEFYVNLPLTTKGSTPAPLPLIKHWQSWKKNNHSESAPTMAPIEKAKPEKALHNELPFLLIIEDNPDVATYIQSCLEPEFFIEVVSNGQDGIEVAQEKLPDIIVCDVMMPQKNGFEVTGMLKSDERTSHIPIILLTAKATRADKLEGLKMGADAYLTKPFHRDELIIRLEKLVELRQNLQAHYSKYIPDSAEEPITLSPDERFLQRIYKIVKENIDDPNLGAQQLYEGLHLSQAQLYRKIKALTGKSPALYIRTIRLRQAKEMLYNTDLNISEIAYALGFNDPNYFTRAFSKEMGTAPSAMRKGLD